MCFNKDSSLYYIIIYIIYILYIIYFIFKLLIIIYYVNYDDNLLDNRIYKYIPNSIKENINIFRESDNLTKRLIIKNNLNLIIFNFILLILNIIILYLIIL